MNKTFQSKVFELNNVVFPQFCGEQVYMRPFNSKNLENIPHQYTSIIKQMIKPFQDLSFNAFLTVDERFVKKNNSHRRGGAHIDGNYVKDDWGGNGGGWLTSNNFNPKSLEDHKALYGSDKGAMIIASNYAACRAWTGNFKNDIRQGGDVSHLKSDLNINASFILKPNTIYLGNSQLVHESLIIPESINRQLIRITLEKDFQF